MVLVRSEDDWHGFKVFYRFLCDFYIYFCINIVYIDIG